VHSRHRQDTKAGVSVALRLALPIAGAFIGGAIGSAAVRSKGDEMGFDVLGEAFVPFEDAILGIAGGMALASAVDVATLAWAPTRAPRVSDPGQAGWSISPKLLVVGDAGGRRTLTFGLSGSL
jgi:hypothetical protein